MTNITTIPDNYKFDIDLVDTKINIKLTDAERLYLMTHFKTIYDNYEFDFDIVDTKINIKLTDTERINLYEVTINEVDICIKPINKFISMIENALSSVPNYSVSITIKGDQIICYFSYITEMVNINETIIFTKVDTQKTKELLLIERVKELTELVTPVFGYGMFGETMVFDINSKILDFRPFDDYTRYSNFQDYNKFKKVTKIIMSTDSKLFCNKLCGNIFPSHFSCGCSSSIQKVSIAANITALKTTFMSKFRSSQSAARIKATNVATRVTTAYAVAAVAHATLAATAKTTISETATDATAAAAIIVETAIASPTIVARCPTHKGHRLSNIVKTLNHFNHPSVYLPSVTEVQVFCSPYDKLEEQFTNFGSLPNLEKLTLIQKDNDGFCEPFFDIHVMLLMNSNKKLKHIVLKNITSWIKPESFDKAKQVAHVNHIKLDFI